MNGPSERERQELYKLIVARSDITSALFAARYVLEHINDLRDELWVPLQDAVIVAYARPFTANKPFGKLPGEWAEFDDGGRQKLHDELIELRNQTIAHSDAAIRKVLVVPPGAPFPPVRGPSGRLAVTVSTQKLPPAAFRAIEGLCLDIGRRLNRAIEERLALMYGATDLPTVPFDLLTNEAEEKG